MIEKIVVAVPCGKENRPIVNLIKNYHSKVVSFCGPEDDVLDRFFRAAKHYQAEIIVRITSDCPLIDPQVIDKVINRFLGLKNADYVSNVIGRRTYPRGLDVEVFSFESLKKIWQKAKSRADREHVTLYFRKHPYLFKIQNVACQKDYSFYRWTLDELSDYKLMKIIYKHIYRKKPKFLMKDVIRLFSVKPELLTINQDVKQKNQTF